MPKHDTDLSTAQRAMLAATHRLLAAAAEIAEPQTMLVFSTASNMTPLKPKRGIENYRTPDSLVAMLQESSNAKNIRQAHHAAKKLKFAASDDGVEITSTSGYAESHGVNSDYDSDTYSIDSIASDHTTDFDCEDDFDFTTPTLRKLSLR
jgi:hypothetical protein